MPIRFFFEFTDSFFSLLKVETKIVDSFFFYNSLIRFLLLLRFMVESKLFTHEYNTVDSGGLKLWWGSKPGPRQARSNLF